MKLNLIFAAFLVLFVLQTLSATKPIFINKVLPEGRYRVTLIFGGNAEGSHNTVKAESRRLMLENVVTAPGKKITKTIVVDVRTPKINETENVKIKPREVSYLNWDNQLNLEITGDNPVLADIKITKADHFPVIFLAGNSTVTDQEKDPYASWGQMLPNFLQPNVVVANYAESGETLLGFKKGNRLKKILSLMKKGDYLLIEFAHNDQKPGGNHLDAFTTYKEELKHYISEARKKGGIPVLVTSTMRRRFDENGKIINTLENYPEAMRQLAKEENIMLIDLNAMSKTLFESLGVELSKKALVHYPANTYPNQPNALADDTHFSPYGAYELAKCVVQSIVDQSLSLSRFVRKDWKKFDPAKPDDPAKFKWFESVAADVLKPDGN